MTDIYEKVTTNKSYYLTLYELENIQFSSPLKKDEKIKSTSMTAEAAKDKAIYLLENNLEMPQDWFGYKSLAREQLEINPKYLACIHVLYTLTSSISKLIELQKLLHDGDISQNDATIILSNFNLWLDGRIEEENSYRDSITIRGNLTNAEAFWREGPNGRTVNTEQHISEEELESIVSVFRKRFVENILF